jgi:hypothetical protein
MKKFFDCLIVGLGQIGMMYDYDKKNKNYLSHVTSVLNSNKISIYGAVDKDKEKRKKFVNKYKLEAFKDIQDIKKKKFDIIILSTPTKTHFNLIKAIIKKFKIKVLLCEKPFTNNFNEASKIYKLTRRKFKTFINYPRIIDPSADILKKKILNSLKFNGNVFYSKSLKNNGSHFINLFIFFFGNPISLKIISKKKKIFLLNFKKADIKFLKKNNIKTNNFYIENKDIKIDYRYSSKNIIIKEKDKKKIIPSFDKKINFNIIKSLESYLLGKKVKLCTMKTALQTQKIINEIEKLN